jgi:hypothetical protein
VGTWDVVKHVVFFGSWIAMETAAGVALSMFFRSYALTLLATYLAVFLVFLATVTISLFTYSLFTLAAGLPWVGFWAVSSAVNGTIFIVLLGGALLLFGPLARWDY